MKMKEITQKTDKELDTMLRENRKQLSQIVIDSRTKQTSNVKQIAAVKKTIARLLTEQKQREINLEEKNDG